MQAISKKRALVYIHFAAILFGSTGIFGAVIQTSAIMITFGRAVFAVISLSSFSYWRSQPVFPILTLKLLLTLGKAGGLLAVHWITFFIAVKLGGVAIATLGFASFPAFITLIEHFIYKETASKREWFALMLVSIGLVLITPTFSFNDSGTIALLWGLLSGLTFALLALSNRYSTMAIAPMQVATMQNSVVALLTLPFVVLELPTVGVINWLWIALLGIVCTGLSCV